MDGSVCLLMVSCFLWPYHGDDEETVMETYRHWPLFLRGYKACFAGVMRMDVAFNTGMQPWRI
jgi:hypothetical protein